MMEKHAEMCKIEMFAEATNPLMQGLDELHSDLKQGLQQSFQEIVESFENGIIKITVQHKKRILERISCYLGDARHAFEYFKVGFLFAHFFVLILQLMFYLKAVCNTYFDQVVHQEQGSD